MDKFKLLHYPLHDSPQHVPSVPVFQCGNQWKSDSESCVKAAGVLVAVDGGTQMCFLVTHSVTMYQSGVKRG